MIQALESKIGGSILIFLYFSKGAHGWSCAFSVIIIDKYQKSLFLKQEGRSYNQIYSCRLILMSKRRFFSVAMRSIFITEGIVIYCTYIKSTVLPLPSLYMHANEQAQCL